MSPIASDQTRPSASNDGVTRNANATWLNVWKFIVEVWYPLKPRYATAPPTNPPSAASASDSARTDTSTAPALNPSARSVAISRARVATAVYIVKIAPKIGADGHQRGDGETYGANERRQGLGL